MPPKRPSIGRQTSDSKRKTREREQESSDEQSQRQETNRHSEETRRAQESAEETRQRQETNRHREQTRRAQQSAEERRQRQETNLHREQTRRAQESAEETTQRQDTNRHREQTRRAQQSPEETRQRQDTNRHREQTRRAQESAEERRQRQDTNRHREQTRRAQESAEETRQRQDTNRHREQTRRAQQSAKETRQRQETHCHRATSRHGEENPPETAQRHAPDRTAKSAFKPAINIVWLKAAFSYDLSKEYGSDPKITIGRMDNICMHCQAKKWPGEAPGLCCTGGKVVLDAIQNPPDVLKNLLTENSPQGKQFRSKLWKYNAAFMMTSFGADKNLTDYGFFSTFKIQGQCYHKIGSLLPLPGEEPKYVQVYFINTSKEEADRRCVLNYGVDLAIITDIQEMLHTTHPYVRSFKLALEEMELPDHKVFIHADKRPEGEHARRFNAPVANEVGVLMVGEQHGSRDIVLKQRDHQLTRIKETHRAYDCLQYPLMFVRGEDGYNFELYQVDPKTKIATNKKVSCKDFYAYHLMERENTFNHILRFKQVLSQFLVDMFAKIETERLLYVRLNQQKLRAADYIHLQDAINADGHAHNVGQQVILPSSHIGSPRYMHACCQDAMAYVRKYGRPDLFITFTCNPKWQEIQNELFDGQTHYDRHDLTARVFHEKHKKLIWLLRHGKIFGELQCFMSTIEWQKRGLPHSHTLIWCKEKIRPEQIDDIISAKLPDEEEDKHLYDIVKKNMVHGPCGRHNPKSPCMQDKKCTKKYPRSFVQETQTGLDGYPLYQRLKPQDGGHSFKLKIGHGPEAHEIVVDNQWIVPYNPLLLKILGAHVNVESCTSIKSIKYVCKYVNKGSDMAVFGVQEDDSDEIKKFQLGRFISSNEAAWRIFGLDIHDHHPTVQRLAVHLKNGQRVYFTEETARQALEQPSQTTLTAFFLLCHNDEFAKTLLYCEVPSHYTWREKKWHRRKLGEDVENWPGVKKNDAISRVYTVSPRHQECYFLRLLLHHVRGPTSFEDLRTHEGHVCGTYREACLLYGLLEDDEHWNLTLQDAAATKHPKQMRQLFAIMLHTCEMSNPAFLWENHKESLSEDIHYRVQCENPDMEVLYNNDILNEALVDVQDRLQALGGSSIEVYGLPTPQLNEGAALSTEMTRETNYNSEELAAFVQANQPKMVHDQATAFNIIMASIEEEHGGLFFLDAPGGTGKTFVTNLILAKVRQKKSIALAVASSGIAATLLDGGRTAHSAFKLPLDLSRQESPSCNISKASAKAKVLQRCKLIIWDEATMSHKRAFEALDRTLKFLRNNDNLMGGVTLVLSGDFRQTLPVITRGTRADEVNACIKASQLWQQTKRLTLSTNFRVQLHGGESAGQFANQLLQTGLGPEFRAAHEPGSDSRARTVRAAPRQGARSARVKGRSATSCPPSEKM
ncbi:hypothetical protein Pcinc_001774 [Petrolisthes cinctipes]|uniref:ATP-dependent DNA helicase n=1 Tax=Petrolisthes cinctipes TaxID=88211 RepID=A0AAE1GQZ3_PETCI|nr:hypothetical protein Pcinc_001774 [Petrolisthes cinctipes]